MNPQNPNDYQNQPQQAYPPAPGQPGPQVYGPQQYTPMPVTDPIMPGQTPPKSNKKLIITIIVLAAFLLLIVVVVIIMNVLKGDQSGSNKITRTYDSPAGLAPGLQAADVKSGKFKLRASYVTGGDFTREGTFTVEDGRMYFDMVPDDVRVNELMKYLYDRRGSKVPFDAEAHGVSRSQTYDMSSIFGYHYLYDSTAGELSGFIPAVEAAKAATKPDKRYTLTTACDSALADVKKKTDMSTTSVIFEVRPEGVNKARAVVSFASRQAIDKAVVAFFDSCFDLDQAGATKLKTFVEGLRGDVKESPTFTYWQEDGVNYIEVSAPPDDTPFGGSLHFELTELSAAAKEHEGAADSYVERRNQFGLAYSLCRVDPVVTTSEKAGYVFMREDPVYGYPHIGDTGYYCTTLAVPPQFKPTSAIALKTATGARSVAAGAAISGLRGHHDLVYEVEKYNLNNKRYPGPLEFRDIANSNMGALTLVTQKIFADKSLVYTPTPAGCVGTCNDFVLSFVPAANVQVRRTTYKP